MFVTLTLQPGIFFVEQRRENGETILIVPLEAVKQSYCNYIASHARPSVTQQQGEKVQ